METHAATAGRRLSTPAARLPAVRSAALWLASLTAAGVALRFATLGLQSYHHDEVITAARVLPGSFGHVLREVRVSESTPPLYYAIAWGWGKLFGLGEAQLRSLSALFGAATIPIAYLIGRELAGRRSALNATALVAVNPMLVWYSQEARAYSLLIFLCAVSLLFFCRALRRGTAKDLLLWGVFSSLALATHYFAAFPVAIEAVLLLAAAPRLRWPALLASIGLIGVTGIALGPLVLHQSSLHHTDWIARFPIQDRLWDTLVAFQVGETGKLIGEQQQDGWAIASVIVLGAALASVAFSKRALRDAAPALLVGLGAVMLALLTAALGQDFVLSRNLLPALVPLLIAAAGALARFRLVGALLAGLLCAYWLGFVVETNLHPDLQRPDWRAVSKDLGPPRSRRALVSWTLGVAPLAYYLDDGTTKVHAGQPVKVRQLDVISDTGAAAGITPPSPLFKRVRRDTEGGLTLTRFQAPHRVGLSYRELRGLPTGFDHNFVMFGKPARSAVRRNLAGAGTARPGSGLQSGRGPAGAARRRIRACAKRRSRSGQQRSARHGAHRVRRRSRERGRRRGARSSHGSTSLRPRAGTAPHVGRGRAARKEPGGRGSGLRKRRNRHVCLRRGSV